MKTPECLFAFRAQLGASIHEPLGRFSSQLVGVGMPSKREGAIPNEIRHNKVSRGLLIVTSLFVCLGRIKRDQMREVEGRGSLDGMGGWEDDVLERDQEIPERAQEVVHLVESAEEIRMEEGIWVLEERCSSQVFI